MSMYVLAACFLVHFAHGYFSGSYYTASDHQGLELQIAMWVLKLNPGTQEVKTLF